MPTISDIGKVYTVARLGARSVPVSHRDDVVQDVVIRLVVKGGGRSDLPSALVYSSARNEAMSWWRREQVKRQLCTALDERAYNVREPVDYGTFHQERRDWLALKDRVRHAVELLPEKVYPCAKKVLAGKTLTSSERVVLKRYRDAFIESYRRFEEVE